MGEFADPTHPPSYARGVGRHMSEAFSRALLNDGHYDVWINPQMSRDAEQIVIGANRSAEIRNPNVEVGGTRLSPNGQSLPPSKVHYVVIGKVTDFLYTRDLPRQASRWGVLGRRNEAIVAIDLKIVDMRSRRVVGAEHIRASIPAGSTDANELHTALPFDSYLFWSTPLGRASKQAIEQAVARTDVVVPPPLVDPQIEQMIAWRRVSIVGGAMAGVSQGQEFYVLLPNWSQHGNGQPVRDAHTGHPLMVRIDSVSRTHSTGWLLGERPLEVSLRGALLSTELPEGHALPAEPEQGPLANMPVAVGGEE